MYVFFPQTIISRRHKSSFFFCFYGVLVWVFKCFQNHHLLCVCNFNFCVIRKGLTWVTVNSPLWFSNTLSEVIGCYDCFNIWFSQSSLLLFFLTLAAWLNGSQCLSGSQSVQDFGLKYLLCCWIITLPENPTSAGNQLDQFKLGVS